MWYLPLSGINTVDDGRRDIAGVVRGGWTMHFSDAIIVTFSSTVDTTRNTRLGSTPTISAKPASTASWRSFEVFRPKQFILMFGEVD